MFNFKKIFLFLLTFFSFSQALNFNAQRYRKAIFDNIKKDSDIVYSTAKTLTTPWIKESSIKDTALAMDIYSPENDTLKIRPIILFFHGGAFLAGTRNNEDMVAMCDSFARMGYVTATVSYRIGMAYGDTNSPTRAVYRGIQDGRSAIRFIRAKSKEYGIDQNHIYVVGSSAGAFIGLHCLYMNELSEKPKATGDYTALIGTPPFQQTVVAEDLGKLDKGLYLDYNAIPNAVVSLWGALQDTTLIKKDDHRPLLLVHGKADEVVPFDFGNPLSYKDFPPTYGSKAIAKRLRSLNISDVDSLFIDGLNHEFYGVKNGNFDDDGEDGPNEYWDTVLTHMKSFLMKQNKPVASFEYSADKLTVSFSSEGANITEWSWDFGDGNSDDTKTPVHKYSKAGEYTVRLTVLNSIGSCDTVSTKISIDLETKTIPRSANNCKNKITNHFGTTEYFDLHGRRINISSQKTNVFKGILIQKNNTKQSVKIMYNNK